VLLNQVLLQGRNKAISAAAIKSILTLNKMRVV
jgi:hypothetical protein